MKYILLLSCCVPLAASSPARTSSCAPCKSPPGNITIESAGLYPENAYFDEKRCVTYISNLFRGTVSTYNVREKHVIETLKIEGVTNNSTFHVGGLNVDTCRDVLSIVADAGAAFDTQGQDISGDNLLIQYDLQTKEFLWRVNLTEISQGVYGGFQDVTHDRFGNSYVIGSYPSSIIKVSPDGSVAKPWYVDPDLNHTVLGFGGAARIEGTETFLVDDNAGGRILRFDMADEEGHPIHVPLQDGAEPLGQILDGIRLPALYHGKVLLVSDDTLGTIVIQSKHGKWAKAEKLGVIPNAFAEQGGFTVASVEMGGRIYVVTEFFLDGLPGNALNRTSFPFQDITDEIGHLIKLGA